jgi:hypothetical protein
MARKTLTVAVGEVRGTVMESTEGNGDGTGLGVEYASTAALPAMLVCHNETASPVTLTILAKSPKGLSQGVDVGDKTQTIAAHKSALVWVPPDFYAQDGVIRVDVSESTGTLFSAFTLPSNSVLKFTSTPA